MSAVSTDDVTGPACYAPAVDRALPIVWIDRRSLVQRVLDAWRAARRAWTWGR